ncbi:MAG: hypothetical protein JO322_09270 [Candidatus Eremiobacteraeota bacterium]|nr:hypothetical protein [Candidatus Eremiobacteraeota bacterium]
MNRTSFLTASASLVAASSGIAAAQSIPGGSHLVERNTDFNAAQFKQIVGRPAKIRQVFEQISFKPQALLNIKNSLNGLEYGYGYNASDIAIAFAAHGPAAALNYNDYLWDKYKLGDFFGAKDAQGATITSNIWVKSKAAVAVKDDPDDAVSMYQDASIEMLQKRGVIFLCCHTAVEEQARNLVKPGAPAAGANPTDVANDILTHLIPGAVVVPSMVSTVAVLQHEYKYTYAALTF